VLRYIAWKCLVNDDWKNGNVCIVSAPNERLATRLLYERLRPMFYNLDNDVTFDSEKKVLELNKVHIESYASNHLEGMRSLVNVKFIFLDEADFWHLSEMQNVIDVSERYIAKSDVSIFMASTPNAPGGLFEQIENEQDSLYNKIFLPWQIGLDTIFSKEEIALQKQSPSFEREYNLRYLGGIGNVFPLTDIESAIEEYPLNELNTTSQYYPTWCGIDPGYSSSLFGICIVQWKDNRLEVVYTVSLDKPLYTDTLKLIRQLVQKYRLCKVFIDSSAAHLIHELKHGYNEYIQYEKLPADILQTYIRSGCHEPLIVPINFQKYHKDMLKHTMKALAKQRVKIHPSFDKLIISLKSATAKAEYDLDKLKTSFNDLLDSFRTSLLCLKAEGEW
jgi:hypothetical protein